jgi:hypothetical protein
MISSDNHACYKEFNLGPEMLKQSAHTTPIQRQGTTSAIGIGIIMIEHSITSHIAGIIYLAMNFGGHLLYGTPRGIMCRSLVIESPTGHATEGFDEFGP